MLAARARRHRHLDVGELGAGADTVEERLPHPVVEQHPGLGVADRVGQRRQQPLATLALGRQDQARLDAELAHTERHRTGQPGADLLGALRGRGLGDHDGVEAAQLAVEGDGVRAGRGRVVQGAAAAHRAGEPGRGDQRMAHQVDTGLEAVHQAQHALRQAGLGGGAAQQRGAQLGGGRVVRVRLDDDGAAGREGAGGVAARHREGEREVAGGVDRDGAQRDLVTAQVGPGRGEAGVGVVDPYVEERALLYEVREGPQLVGGAAEFAGEPAGAERGLGVGGLDDRLARVVEQIGGAAQQRGAYGTVGERVPGRVGGTDHGVHLVGRGLHRNLFALLPGSGVDTPDWCCCCHRAFLPGVPAESFRVLPHLGWRSIC